MLEKYPAKDGALYNGEIYSCFSKYFLEKNKKFFSKDL